MRYGKGYYFTYDEKNPIRFNPFYIEDGDTLDTEKKESIKTLLLALGKRIMKHLIAQSMWRYPMPCNYIMSYLKKIKVCFLALILFMIF